MRLSKLPVLTVIVLGWDSEIPARTKGHAGCQTFPGSPFPGLQLCFSFLAASGLSPKPTAFKAKLVGVGGMLFVGLWACL